MPGTGEPRPRQESEPDDPELLDVLLEYVRQTLHADHACLSESTSISGPITVIAAAGRLAHPELWPGLGEMDEVEYGYDGSDEQAANDVVGVYRRGDPATPGVSAFLERVGAAFDITIRVFEADERLFMLELYYCDPDQPFGPEQVEEATRLAPMLAAVFTRDRLNRQLSAAEQRYRALVEQIPAFPYVLDENEQVTFHVSRLSGLMRVADDEPFSFDDWAGAIHPDDRERVVGEARRHMATGDPFDTEYRIVLPSGEILWFHDRATIVEDAEGRRSLGVMFDITERRKAEEALRESEQQRFLVLEEMLRAESDARSQIAPDLHDDTIQVMTASMLGIERALKALDRGEPERIREALEAARETMGAAIERARRMTFDLRPPLLATQGLAAAVTELAQVAAAEAGFEVQLDLSVMRHSLGIEDLAYRTVKEALQNTRKHAGAAHVGIRLWEADGALSGEVTDDGIGFDVERALDRRTMRLHMGLDTMRERLGLVGGSLDIASAPGAGSTIAFTIPSAA
jgi:two-component system sensor histidine kinase UhpB